jgi:probable phosphoglycerate mutase
MPEPRLVVIVRHAESEHHIQRLTGGWTDTPLTLRGHEQSALLAARLRDEFAGAEVALFTSDFLRAAQTAQHIADALGVPPNPDQRLREHNNGEAAGLTMQEAAARWPAAWETPWRIDDRPFPGSETGREFYARVGAFIDDLDLDPVAIPIVVSHGAAIDCLVASWLRLTPEALEPIGFSAHPTAISVLSTDRHGNRIVERLNDASPLAPAGPRLRDLFP